MDVDKLISQTRYPIFKSHEWNLDEAECVYPMQGHKLEPIGIWLRGLLQPLVQDSILLDLVNSMNSDHTHGNSAE
jgi:hypothetical protein